MADAAPRTFTTRAGRSIPFGALGFGSAPLGNMHCVLSEAEADETLQAAWDTGARFFDTAPLYGHGLSEMRIGRALRSRPRDAFVLSTKVGRLLEPCAPGEEESGIFKNTPQVRIRFDYSYDGVMRSYEASLFRLGLDRIDVLLVHDVDARSHGGTRAASEAYIRELVDRGGWRALSELRSSGAVAAIGIGVNEWEPCARVLEVADPDVFLLAGRYTLLEQTPLHTLFPTCAKRGVGVVIGGPFNSGVLVGQAFYDYASAPTEIVSRVRALDAVCKRFDVPLAAAALQFPLAHPVVISVIPGGQNAAEVRTNAAWLKEAIPEELWRAFKSEKLLDDAAPVPNTESVAC